MNHSGFDAASLSLKKKLVDFFVCGYQSLWKYGWALEVPILGAFFNEMIEKYQIVFILNYTFFYMEANVGEGDSNWNCIFSNKVI